jgi:hypothetical protein
LAAAAVSGRLYAIGERVNGDYDRNLTANEAYDPVADRWEEKAPLPTARSGIAASRRWRRSEVWDPQQGRGLWYQDEQLERLCADADLNWPKESAHAQVRAELSRTVKGRWGRPVAADLTKMFHVKHFDPVGAKNLTRLKTAARPYACKIDRLQLESVGSMAQPIARREPRVRFADGVDLNSAKKSWLLCTAMENDIALGHLHGWMSYGH